MRRLVALGICAALVLPGCGGDSSSDSESASTASGTTPSAPQALDRSTGGQGEGKGEQGEEKKGSPVSGDEKDRGSSSEDPQSTRMVRVPPISSAPTEGSEAPAPGVKTVKGADNSVQTYGIEASDGARTEAAIALQAYLNARLQGDWQAVCAALALPARTQLDKFLQQLKSRDKELGGCAAAMAMLEKGTSQSQLREDATITEVLSFRGEGDVPGGPSYLLFLGLPGQTLYSMPMYLEAGAWKVGLALPSELPV